MRNINQRLLGLLILIVLFSCLACQKKQLDLAEAAPAEDAPEYTVKADVNVAGGVEQEKAPQ